MELKNTIELMLSDNYEDRLKAEYMQLKIRIEKLSTYLDVHKVKPTDERYTQLYAMKLYLDCLEKRLYVINKNNELKESYEYISMIMDTVADKLQKAPQFNK